MKMVVFAHTPPPLHGQSLMVQLMLDGLAECRDRSVGSPSRLPAVVIYHVDARLSRDLEDVGSARWQKGFLLVNYCFQAIWLRLRYGPRVFYFVPAAPIRSSLYRDWLVMLLCRALFRRTIFHWHAVGLGDWLETHGKGWERTVSHALMDGVDLSIVLSRFNEADAAKFRPKRVAVVANGIPDPCPDYDRAVAPERAARRDYRRRALQGQAAGSPPPDLEADGPDTVRVLFMAHCTRDKGVFEAVEGVRLANAKLAAGVSRVRLELRLAGGFRKQSEKAELETLLSQPHVAGQVHYLGFLEQEAKLAALRHADLFCFPTYFASEGQPVNLLEAMAFGLPIVTTRWRSIPELLPNDYPGLVEPRQPEQVAEALIALLQESGAPLRDRFRQRFTFQHHLESLGEALASVTETC